MTIADKDMAKIRKLIRCLTVLGSWNPYSFSTSMLLSRPVCGMSFVWYALDIDFKYRIFIVRYIVNGLLIINAGIPLEQTQFNINRSS